MPVVRPLRRSLVLAFAAVLLIAALVTAAVLGVPGIRILFGPGPTATLTPSSSPGDQGPPGSSLGLGARMDVAQATTRVDFTPRLPTDPAIGPPSVAYLADDRLTLVWAASPALPATADPGVGLLLTEFRGVVDEGSYTKMIGSGTRVEPVRVAGVTGYWISGGEHFIFYESPNGVRHDANWRAVGDALIWHDGDLTYRLESALGRDATIRLAESLAAP